MTGLGIGGDDYITKPFGLGELRARVSAHLRRENREKKHVITFGELSFSMNSRQVFFQGERNTLLQKVSMRYVNILP